MSQREQEKIPENNNLFAHLKNCLGNCSLASLIFFLTAVLVALTYGLISTLIPALKISEKSGLMVIGTVIGFVGLVCVAMNLSICLCIALLVGIPTGLKWLASKIF